MFNDMRSSDETMTAYRSHLARTSTVRPLGSSCNVLLADHLFLDPQAPPFDLSVNVLTSTYWTGTTSAPGTLLPPLLGDAIASFEKFYLSRHSGRCLTWQPNQGTADVRVRFKAKVHELNVSTFALVVLLLFEGLEEGEEIPYEVRPRPQLLGHVPAT